MNESMKKFPENFKSRQYMWMKTASGDVCASACFSFYLHKKEAIYMDSLIRYFIHI